MRTIILFLAIFSGILKTSAETYTSQFSGYVNEANMWKKSDGTIVTLGDNTEFRNPVNTFNVNHVLNVVTFWDGDTGSKIVINSGGSLNILSGGNLRNSIVTVNNGGTLNISGNIGNGTLITNTGTGIVTARGVYINNNNSATVTGKLSITDNISLDNGSFTLGAGSVATANSLITGNNSIFTNHGNLTFSAAASLNGSPIITNSGNMQFAGNLSLGNDGVINNSGTVIVPVDMTLGGGAKINNSSATSLLTVGGDLKIDVNQNPGRQTDNYGTITVGDALKYSNGVFNNYYSGANTGAIKVAGTGSLLNSTVKIANGGFVEFLQELQIVNATIKNTLSAHNGTILAKGGLYLENDGCIDGGSLDYWGIIRRNAAAENGGDYKCKLLNVDLPVQIVFFVTSKIQNKIQLSWGTSSETNNDFFQLEVSTDGCNYSLLGTIEGAGNSSTELQYEFLHNQPSIGVNYYRLSQTDFDGQKQYFAPIAVHYSNLEALIYPTVIHGDDIVNVQMSSITDDVPFQIISQDGKILTTGTISNNAELASDLFQYGLNQLIIGSENTIITTSIVKQ